MRVPDVTGPLRDNRAFRFRFLVRVVILGDAQGIDPEIP